MNSAEILKEVVQMEGENELMRQRIYRLKAMLADVSTTATTRKGLTAEQRSQLINSRRKHDLKNQNR